MEITPGHVGAASAAISAISLIAGAMIRGAFNNVHEKIDTIEKARVAACAASTVARGVLFQKHDLNADSLQAFRLHVAEKYVNREALAEQLAPLAKGIQEIKDDMRDARNRKETE